MIKRYDREGNEISMMRLGELLMDEGYKRVALDRVGVYEISTVWVGTDYNFSIPRQGPPIIFETLVFGPGERWDMDGRRYATEAEALAGHNDFVTLIRATVQEDLAVEELDKEERE